MINSSFKDALFEFLTFRSISTDERHKKDMIITAKWLQDYLIKNGSSETRLIKTQGNPLVFSHYLIDEKLPTLLFYGHYDVQPPGDQLDWQSDPFVPEIREGKVFARGAVDDKGQIIAFLEAFKEVAAKGNLIFNIKILLEGEEEIGSRSITEILTKSPELFKADYVVVADTAMIDSENPAITYGLRGYVGFELKLQNTVRDIHSGVYGGIVDNPINILCEIISSLKDQNNQKIIIPNFYDNVEEINKHEKHRLDQLPIDQDRYLDGIGARKLASERHFSFLESAMTRPTLDINGIFGGYTSEGTKTIIPATATAKISMRLVKNQLPEEIFELTTSYIRNLAPSHINCDIRPFGLASPVVMDINSEIFKSVESAVAKVYNKNPHYIRDGGSIPIIATLRQQLNAECVLLGFGLPEDNLHAPNECISVERLQRAYSVFKELLSS